MPTFDEIQAAAAAGDANAYYYLLYEGNALLEQEQAWQQEAAMDDDYDYGYYDYGYDYGYDYYPAEEYSLEQSYYDAYSDPNYDPSLDQSYYQPNYGPDPYADPYYEQYLPTDPYADTVPELAVDTILPPSTLPTSEELFALQGIDPNIYMDQMNEFFDSFVEESGAPGGILYTPPTPAPTAQELQSFFDSLFSESMNVAEPFNVGPVIAPVMPQTGGSSGSGLNIPLGTSSQSSAAKQDTSVTSDITKLLSSILNPKPATATGSNVLTPTTQQYAQSVLPVAGSGANAIQSFMSSNVAGIPLPLIAGGIIALLFFGGKK